MPLLALITFMMKMKKQFQSRIYFSLYKISNRNNEQEEKIEGAVLDPASQN